MRRGRQHGPLDTKQSREAVPRPPQSSPRLPASPPKQGVYPTLIPAHRPSFTHDATTRTLSGRVLCSAPTSAAVIPTVAVIIPAVASIGVDPNPARADFDALGLRGGASNYQRSRK
jgi:hypothetical protein